MLRLDKYLADMGTGTRQEVKKYIRQGRVRVGDETVKRPEYKVDEAEQEVFFDGKQISYSRFEYYMLNKPSGVVSATRDRLSATVVELIGARQRKDLFPVGRLDKDTEGLLLITNDGELAHRLLSPKKHVDKQYFARIDGILSEEEIRRFREGLDIGTDGREEWTMPAGLRVVSTDSAAGTSEVRVTIREGKYHQIRRMFHALGREVRFLKRERMGSLMLDESLKSGEYRSLTPGETALLKMESRGLLENTDAFIFDLDGTLLDSMWVWVKIDEEYLEKYDLAEPENFHADMEGKSYSEVAQYFTEVFPTLAHTVDEIMDEWTQMAHEKYMTQVPMKSGAKEFLTRLKQMGKKTGIATSNGKELVMDTLRALGIDGMFDSVRSACEVAAGKPSPDVYLLVAEDIGAEPERCLVFEDIPMGILAGKNAGMKVCAVEDEFSREQEAKKRELADYYIKDYREILKGTYEVL